jgi:Family of unknown function (DUF5313)
MTSLRPERILLGMTRPNPLLWIWYTLGGKLGPPYREWVLHDTTCRTRWLRQILSFMDLIVLPTALVLAVLGVSSIVWAGVGLGLLLALGYSLAYINSTAERRLAKHGYGPGTLERALRERDDVDEIVRYVQTCRTAAE